MTVRVETEAGVAKVILDNPAQLNALNATMKDQLIDAFQGFAKDDAVRAVILTGANKAFCSGSDVTLMGQSDIRGDRRRLHTAHTLIRAMMHLEKPIIAAVRGPAVGLDTFLELESHVQNQFLAKRAPKFEGR
ncbi:MAG: enoyl-CoA hydratase/isomerase family protein [Polaromonas sp.]|nr:enoyl-CoA hydratase/isomerase family protein [Polaromonas sp.]